MKKVGSSLNLNLDLSLLYSLTAILSILQVVLAPPLFTSSQWILSRN